MAAVIRLLSEKFPEPEFFGLQRAVFAEVQRESAALAEVLAVERSASSAAEAAKALSSPMVRFGAYVSERLVGWSCGWFERGDCFYMANSGVRPENRRQGVYSALLEAVVLHAGQSGAHVVRSQHSVLNNPVLICKLKRGFHVTGVSASAHLGTLVELSLHLSAPRQQLFRARVIPFVAPQ